MLLIAFFCFCGNNHDRSHDRAHDHHAAEQIEDGAGEKASLRSRIRLRVAHHTGDLDHIVLHDGADLDMLLGLERAVLLTHAVGIVDKIALIFLQRILVLIDGRGRVGEDRLAVDRQIIGEFVALEIFQILAVQLGKEVGDRRVAALECFKARGNAWKRENSRNNSPGYR